MESLAIVVLLRAKPGKEAALEEFLTSALTLVNAEPQTLRWYAARLAADRFAIFDTFRDERGRDAHLAGEVAKALLARADELLADPPVIERARLLAVKADAGEQAS